MLTRPKITSRDAVNDKVETQILDMAMARSRNIKPGFTKNEFLAQRTFEARLLFALLPTIADREGRLEDRPLRIKGELFPYEGVDVELLLSQLAEVLPGQDHPFIVRYQVDGKRYIQIVKFLDNQCPHKDEKPSVIPSYEEASEAEVGIVVASCSQSVSITQHAESELKNKGIRYKETNNSVSDPLTKGNDATEHIDPQQREFVDLWNNTRGVHKLQSFSKKRAQAFQNRLGETIDGVPWFETLKDALQRKFPLQCTSADPHSWLPDVDWILKPDSLLKIMEGKYDFKPNSGKTPATTFGPGQRFDPQAPAEAAGTGW